MKIGFFGINGWERERLAQALQESGMGDEVVFVDARIDKEHLPAQTDFEAIGVFVNSSVSKEVLAHFPNLQLVATLSTGYDHIDLDECRARGITVVNVPSYGENTVAEFAFALMLTLARKVYDAYHRVRESGSFSLEGLRGFDLYGKTLGVVGTGRIGRHMIRLARGAGMEVVAFDVYPDEAFAKEAGFRYLPLEDVLAKSDIVTLHVPYLPSTHHLLDDKTFALMKKGSYLINTSRGAVVNTDALVRALQEGRLAGAALDVLEEEGVIKDEVAFLTGGHPEEHNLKVILENHALIDMPNVIITPHTAFNTWEAVGRIIQTTVNNIAAFRSGKPTNVVTK